VRQYICESIIVILSETVYENYIYETVSLATILYDIVIIHVCLIYSLVFSSRVILIVYIHETVSLLYI